MIIVSPAGSFDENLFTLRKEEMHEIYRSIIITGNVELALEDPDPYSIDQQANHLLWGKNLMAMCLYGTTIHQFLTKTDPNFEALDHGYELDHIMMSAAEDVEDQALSWPLWLTDPNVQISHQRYLASIDSYYSELFNVTPTPWPVLDYHELKPYGFLSPHH